MSTKLSQKKLKAFDAVFEYYENKSKDLIQEAKISNQSKLANFLNNGLKKVKLDNVMITQSDISRLKNEYPGRYKLKKDAEGFFVLKTTHTRKPLDSLADSIDISSAKGFFDASVLALNVDKIYADRLGVDFIDTFPDEVLGYIKNEGLLLVIFKSKQAKDYVKNELENRDKIDLQL